MKVTEDRKTRHLQLNHLTTDLRLAQRLPRDLAFRYHALPVTERDGCITVAMANPEDDVACNAVSTALGKAPYMVRGDPEAIDALLSEVWSEQSPRQLRILVCDNPCPMHDENEGSLRINSEVWEYATALSTILAARATRLRPDTEAVRSLATMTGEIADAGYDLIVVGESEQSRLHRLVFGPAERNIAERVPVSLLVARKPRWPIEKILLVARCSEADDAATEWVIRLARPSSAAVTILTIMPPLPVMYQQLYGMDVALSPHTVSGKRLRQLAQQLDKWNIAGMIRLRQGDPDWQICQEVAEGQYDLIVISAEPCSRLERWLLGGIVGPLLCWVDRPTLIAKSRCEP